MVLLLLALLGLAGCHYLAPHEAAVRDGAQADLRVADADDPRDVEARDVEARDVEARDVDHPDLHPVPGVWVVVPPMSAVSQMPATFMMGSLESEACRKVSEQQHEVTLTRRFELLATEVTQAQFEQLVGYNPATFQSCGDTCPAETVNWHDCAVYSNALSLGRGLEPCYSCSGAGANLSCDVASKYDGASLTIYDCPGYRMPTDAEWEYAYRAGSATPLYPSAGNDGSVISCSEPDANADKIAWYSHNAESMAHPAAQKAPNAWGLYDMAGNTGEWIHDWYSEDLGKDSVTDPWGPASGTQRIGRGGAWNSSASTLRAARRYSFLPTIRGSQGSCRCARSLP